MTNAGADLSKSLFSEGLRVVHEHALKHRVGDLLSENDWGLLNQDVLEPGIIIGTDSVIRGLKLGVTHALHFRIYGEGSNSSGANHGGYLTDIRVYAAEGTFDDKVLDQQEYKFSKGMGTLCGMVIFSNDGNAHADFAHGSGPSINPMVNQRMEEIVDTLGLPHSIIGPNNSDQFFDYDDAAMLGLINNIPYAHQV